MDITKMIEELKVERANVEQAIAVMERPRRRRAFANTFQALLPYRMLGLFGRILQVKKLCVVLGLSALASMTALAGEFTGYLSDEKCAVSGAKAKTAAEWIQPKAFESCVKSCVKSGEAVVFVTEDNKILKIEASSMDKVTPVIGHKVKVTGKVDGGKLTVDSISTLPM